MRAVPIFWQAKRRALTSWKTGLIWVCRCNICANMCKPDVPQSSGLTFLCARAVVPKCTGSRGRRAYIIRFRVYTHRHSHDTVIHTHTDARIHHRDKTPHTNRQAGTKANRQTGRQAERQRHTQNTLTSLVIIILATVHNDFIFDIATFFSTYTCKK